MASKIGVLLASYLIGAIPFGVLISKYIYGINIREHGSRNTGATNVWRVLGKKAGIITLLLDILKGVAAVLLARRFFPFEPWMEIAAGLVSIIGHNWSVFLMGSGGKGVATSAGVFLALIPIQMLIALFVFAFVFVVTRYVSVGSISAAVALLITSVAFNTPLSLRIVILIAAAMLIIKHIPNMRRLARGEELKVNFK